MDKTLEWIKPCSQLVSDDLDGFRLGVYSLLMTYFKLPRTEESGILTSYILTYLLTCYSDYNSDETREEVVVPA